MDCCLMAQLVSWLNPKYKQQQKHVDVCKVFKYCNCKGLIAYENKLSSGLCVYSDLQICNVA